MAETLPNTLDPVATNTGDPALTPTPQAPSAGFNIAPKNEPGLQDYITQAKLLGSESFKNTADIMNLNNAKVGDQLARKIYSQNLGASSGVGQQVVGNAMRDMNDRLAPYAAQTATDTARTALEAYQTRQDKLETRQWSLADQAKGRGYTLEDWTKNRDADISDMVTNRGYSVADATTAFDRQKELVKLQDDNRKSEIQQQRAWTETDWTKNEASKIDDMVRNQGYTVENAKTAFSSQKELAAISAKTQTEFASMQHDWNVADTLTQRGWSVADMGTRRDEIIADMTTQHGWSVEDATTAFDRTKELGTIAEKSKQAATIFDMYANGKLQAGDAVNKVLAAFGLDSTQMPPVDQSRAMADEMIKAMFANNQPVDLEKVNTVLKALNLDPLAKEQVSQSDAFVGNLFGSTIREDGQSNKLQDLLVSKGLVTEKNDSRKYDMFRRVSSGRVTVKIADTPQNRAKYAELYKDSTFKNMIDSGNYDNATTGKGNTGVGEFRW